MSDVLDLDALVPKTAIVKFDGKEIEIKPPTTGQLLKMASVGGKLQDADKLTPDELTKTIEDFTNQIYELIPELQGRPLNATQLLKLVELINSMAVPPEATELSKRGIEVDGSKKAE